MPWSPELRSAQRHGQAHLLPTTESLASPAAVTASEQQLPDFADFQHDVLLCQQGEEGRPGFKATRADQQKYTQALLLLTLDFQTSILCASVLSRAPAAGSQSNYRTSPKAVSHLRTWPVAAPSTWKDHPPSPPLLLQGQIQEPSFRKYPPSALLSGSCRPRCHGVSLSC